MSIKIKYSQYNNYNYFNLYIDYSQVYFSYSNKKDKKEPPILFLEVLLSANYFSAKPFNLS